MGIHIGMMQGQEGRAELAGTKAVLAMFYKWTLTRRGETDQGDPVWSLRASLSYQKDQLLKSDKYRKIVRIKPPKSDIWWQVIPREGKEFTWNPGELTCEEITLWREEPR